jgi:hypothetical protein
VEIGNNGRTDFARNLQWAHADDRAGLPDFCDANSRPGCLTRGLWRRAGSPAPFTVSESCKSQHRSIVGRGLPRMHRRSKFVMHRADPEQNAGISVLVAVIAVDPS